MKFSAAIRPSIVTFAKNTYGTGCAFGTKTLSDYHQQLAITTHSVMSTYFNSLSSLAMCADAGNRVTTVCEAAWLLSVIGRNGTTIDEVFAAAGDRVANLVASCTPDARLFASRRADQLIGQLPNLPIDAKLLLLANQCLLAELRRPMDKYTRVDIQRTLAGLSSLSSFPALSDMINKSLKLLEATKQ